MTEPPFATATDVAARWRTLTSDEQKVANQLALDASDMIRSRWPSVDSRIGSGALTAASLTRVVASMVKRAMMNGEVEGIASRAQAAGPFSKTDTYANPNANLYFTAEDIRLLDGRPPRRAFAVDLSPGMRPDWCG
ncbi:MAG: hypothetical protein JWO15_3843 [Sphingomonadales bacterium]|nr:hypothetical protein [Sphingomonadales bacterium]